MLSCEQTKGQSVFQHGQSVQQHLFELLDYLKYDNPLNSTWRVPTWLTQFREPLASSLHSEESLAAYTLYHDCGKPFCQSEDGTHFPDHAAVSKQVFLEATGDDVVANLIGYDMVIHTASAEEIQHHLDNLWSKEDAITLLLAALAEVHSNAKLFGGTDSTSFKMKWKTIEKRGKQICKYHFA